MIALLATSAVHANAIDDSEAQLNKYTNAFSVCSKITDPDELYERGTMLLQDNTEESLMAASECFASAAIRNHTPSQLELGKLYEAGKGVNISNEFAYKWFQTAVLLGNVSAIPYRDNVESKMSVEELQRTVPMIASTLSLIEMYNKHQEDEIKQYEEKVDEQLREFGVNVHDYDYQVEKKQEIQGADLLIDSIIRDQQLKEAEETLRRQAEAQQKANSESNSRRRRANNVSAEE